MRDDWLDSVVRELKRPTPVRPDFDRRLGAALARTPRPRGGWLLGVGAMAAGALLTTFLWKGRSRGPAPVEFLIDAPAARAVTLVGDFNDWDRRRTPLERVIGTSRWRARVPLHGGLYRYVFLVDGERWVADSTQLTAPDPDFGTTVSLVTVR